MARPDQKPGRRRAAPEPRRRLGRRNGGETSHPAPSAAHPSTPDAAAPEPTPGPTPAPPARPVPAAAPVEAPVETPAEAGVRGADPARDQREEPRTDAGTDPGTARGSTGTPPLELHPEVPLVPGPTATAPEIPDLTQRRTRWRTVSHGGLTLGWLLVVGAALAAMLTGWVDLPVPAALQPWLPPAGAVVVTTTYAATLAVRTGGRPLLALLLAALFSAGAVVSGVPLLLAASAVVTAAMGGVLGVLSTVPAARYAGAVRECLVAALVAAVAAFAANAYDADISVERSRYLALALALLGTLALVYRLGAGLHGLGTRGAIVVTGGIGLLAVTLAYTEALARWGSPDLIQSLETTWRTVQQTIGAVPRPLEALLGFPALAWGVTTRARRRQGWWPCAFGAVGLAGIASSLLDPRVALLEAGLRLGYGLAIGLVLGYLVVRVDAFLSGTRGARARRAEEASAHRPEPRRTAALL